MVVQQLSDEKKQEIERFLVTKVESLRFMVTGLENHQPFLKLVEMWAETEKQLDANWHRIHDPIKLMEARATKFSAQELTNIIEYMRSDLTRAEIELEKLRNPDNYVNKDYDTE